MKSFVVVALCVVFVAVVWARPEEKEEKYEDIIPEVDVDEALNNDRLRKNYLSCFKTGEKCTKQARRVKEVIPEALTTKCKKCTDNQKAITKKVIRFLIKNHPDEYLDIEKTYDPDRKYRADYEEEFKKEGIILPN